MKWLVVKQRVRFEDGQLIENLQAAEKEAGFSWDNLKSWITLYPNRFTYGCGFDRAVRGRDRFDLW